MSVSLKVPRQRRRPWFRRPRPATYRRLAGELPLDRPGETLERLDHALQELNATACGARRRIRCMAPLAQAMRHVQADLGERLALERVPLSAEAAEYAEAAVAAWSRLAVGYLCALEDLPARERAVRQDAALGGLHALGRVMLTRYHQYVPEPQGTWRAVHELREAAGEAADGGGRPDAETGDAGDASTAYKQLLVLAATGPMRLRQADQAALYRVLAGWVRHVSVQPLRGAEPKGPPIVFRPGEDEPPRQYPVDQMPDAPGLRLIDPAPLAGRARHRLERMETGDRPSRPSEEFLRTETLRVLLAAWSGAPARQFPRSEGTRATHLTVGLAPAWEAVHGRESPGRRCRLVDQSAAGYRVMLEHAPRGLVEVGELVAIRQDDAWVLGIVRWLRQGPGAALQVGVETVSRQPRPVRLRADGDAECKAFVIEGNRAAHTPASVIMPRLDVPAHSSVRVDGSGESLTLGRLLETTGSLCRYRIEGPEPEA